MKDVDILSRYLTPSRHERLRAVAAERTKYCTVVLDGVKNEHNISAVLRSADAFGLAEVHYVGSQFAHAKGITLGADRWLDLHLHQTSEAALDTIRSRGFSVAVLQAPDSPSAGSRRSVPITELPFERRLAMVFGHERDGVSQEFREQADFFAHIPMYGFVESLNISVAAAICMFSATLAPTVPTRRSPRLSKDEQSELLSYWLHRDIKHAEKLIAAAKDDGL